MAFETVVRNEQNTKMRVPFISVKWSRSGNPRGYVSAMVMADAERFYFEMDTERKQVRIKAAPEGKKGDSISLGGGGRNFAFSKHAMREIGGDKRIILELKDDGWYYGSYA